MGSQVSEVDINKGNFKTPFSAGKSILIHSKTIEHIFDYIFQNLNIDETQIDHPLLVTECLFNPKFSREMLAELLFECYNVRHL